jgi:predicted nucleotide-binding protein
MPARKRAGTIDDGRMPPPSLRVPRAQAADQIRTQIEKGDEIEKRTLWSPEDLERARQDRRRWADRNSELLSRLFDNQSIADEYNFSIGIAFGGPTTWPQQVKEFKEDMAESLNRLNSVMDRLDLIPEPSAARTSSTPTEPVEVPPSQNVFIVHGRDEAAKQAVARYLERLDLEPIILHERASKGTTLIEKIEANSIGVGYVVVLLTPDDVGKLNEPGEELAPRARQNVIFELGWFLGKLGRDKVCALKKGKVDILSDYPVLYIPMDDAGAWKHELAKELYAAKIKFDYNKALKA